MIFFQVDQFKIEKLTLCLGIIKSQTLVFFSNRALVAQEHYNKKRN